MKSNDMGSKKNDKGKTAAFKKDHCEDPFTYTKHWERLLKSKDPQVVEDTASALFDKLFQKAFGYAIGKHIVGERDARDAASQAVGTMIRRAADIERYSKSRLATLKDRGELFSYLNTTIVRRCLKFKRKNKEVIASDFAIHHQGSGKNNGAEGRNIIEQAKGSTPSSIEMAAHDEMLTHLISHLKGRDRAILALRLEGRSKVDIARSLCCSRATVHRAFDRFKDVLKRFQDS